MTCCASGWAPTVCQLWAAALAPLILGAECRQYDQQAVGEDATWSLRAMLSEPCRCAGQVYMLHGEVVMLALCNIWQADIIGIPHSIMHFFDVLDAHTIQTALGSDWNKKKKNMPVPLKGTAPS